MFEDDIILHRQYSEGVKQGSCSESCVGTEICGFIADSQAQGAHVAYLGHLDSGRIKWGTHALWITPYGARFLLQNTAQCYTRPGDGTDSTVVSGCRKMHIACAYARPRRQKPQHFGGRHGFLGYFVQDRVNVSSYLHTGKGRGKQVATVASKDVWAPA